MFQIDLSVLQKNIIFVKSKFYIMENFINYIHINNFKSIQDLRLDNCKRINLFVGYPNVGKSNVLEALGLNSTPFLNATDDIHKLVRFENERELFYNATTDNFSIETNLHKICCQSPDIKQFIPMWDWKSNILKYDFRLNNQWQSINNPLLLPPFGENIIDVLSFNQNVSEVKKWIVNEFTRNKKELVLDKITNSLKFQQRLNENEVFILPYSSLSDTLQRMIFYKTAIASNKNSVLLFEEPEAHAFPPYIQTVMQDIIDSKSNQFFLVTHSPLVVNAFLEYEKIRNETSIYLFDFKENQTIAKRLSDEEMELVYEYGVDLFFNLESFLEDE
jgi:AAA15 family ATPase/GTPase